MTIDETISIANAIKAGNKQIERAPRGTGIWVATDPARQEFNPFGYDYRIKPDPRQVWLKTRSDGTPTAVDFGVALREAPQPGSDGNWVHFVEMVP